MKHNWEKDENGNVNEWAWESGFHNGVFCVDCGKSVCVHCDPDYMELDDCTGPEPGIDAATALSTLQAENEKLRAELENYRKGHCSEGGCAAEKDRDAVLAELEQVKRERDAIEQDFRAFAKQWWEEDSGFPCRWCKFENSGGCEWKAKHPNEEKICAGRAFEWRGPEKED